uniref:Uncharacterized protein n=1 Tax=Tanacetum cinerariifolium TaxID=118510 RepID=A0A6L2NLZ6_TANCI|nr:hypothetical protein [Tanacetum cinerariifolium]
MYQENLAEFWHSAKELENSKVCFSIPTRGIYGEVGLNIFRNAIGAYYLPYSSKYVALPSIDVVWKWFPMIEYGKEVSTKGSLRKSLLPPRWRLLMALIIQCLGGKTGEFDQITNKDAIMLYSLANGIHIDYANIFWEDIILKLKKKQREKVVPYTLFLSLLIMHKMKEDYDHMLAICALDKLVVFKAPKTSSKDESVSQGAKPRAKIGHKKPTTSSKHPLVTNEERANPQLSSGMSALNLNKPIFFASFIIHSEAASGDDVSTDFTAEADPGLSAPNDSIPSQQGMDEGTKNTSYDHMSSGTDPHKKGASSTAIHSDKEEASTIIQGDKEEASITIKLEDLTKLVSQIQPSFKDLGSPEDDLVIIVDKSDKHEPNAETKDTSVPRSSSPCSLPTELKDLPSKLNKLTEEIKGLKTQVHELEIELPKE